MKTKEAQEIKSGDVLGDGFVVDGVYMTMGAKPRHYWATGLRWGFSPSRQHLGTFGHKLTVKS